jgi:hypothetical protein
MTLPPDDGKLFFELMWKLQYYVNQKRGFHKNISSLEEYASLPTEKKLKARDELWKNTELIDSYVQENPDSLPATELEIVRKWKDFIKDSFFIFRHLKKGSIFIRKNNQVYAVHGIQDSLDEVIPSFALPRMVEAILLPFKGRIIYDGLLSGYNVHFGGGIRSDLDHTYTVAKHKGHIITTLEAGAPTLVAAKPKDTALPQLKDLSAAMSKLKGASPLQNSALALAHASLELSIADAEGTLSSDNAEARARKILKASTRLLNLLDMMAEE